MILRSEKLIILIFFIPIVMTAFCYGARFKALAKNMSIYITNLKRMLLTTMKFRHGQMISVQGIAAEFPGFLPDSSPGKSSARLSVISFFYVLLFIPAFTSTSTNIRGSFPICRIQLMRHLPREKTLKLTQMDY